MARLFTGLLSFIVIAALTVFVVVRAMTPPAPVVVATLKSEPQRMTFADGVLYWLESEERSHKPSRLMQLRPGSKEARALLSNTKIKSFAVAGQDVYYIEENTSSVNRLSISGGQPTEVARDVQDPGEVYADETHLYWTATAPAAVSFVSHVPIAHHLPMIYRASRDGTSPRMLAVAGSTSSTFEGRLITTHDGNLYWVEWMEVGQGRATTALRKVNAEGQVSLLALGVGKRECLRYRDSLYCTGWSDAATPPSRYVAVKRIPLTGRGETTLTDWLDVGGVLMAGARGVYYLRQHRVWIVPERQQAPEVAMQVDEAETVCYLHDGWLFSYVMPGVAQATVLKRRAFRRRGFLMRFFGLGQ